MQYSGAVFTMRLKDVLAATGGTVEIGEDGVSIVTGGNIGLNNYPIWTADPSITDLALPDYRPHLNGLIFDHYQNREIGVESIGLFQNLVRRRMNESMHVINKMYLSELINILPLSTVDLTTDNTANDTQTNAVTAATSSTSEAISKARSVSSDTPQTMLAGDEDYATSASDSNSDNTTTGSGTNNTTSTVTDAATGNTHTTGYQGNASDLLLRFRQTFINPNMMVINELEDCFMQIWDNGDSFTNHDGIGAGYIGY